MQSLLRIGIKSIELIVNFVYYNLIRPMDKVITRKVTGSCEIERCVLSNDLKGLGFKLPPFKSDTPFSQLD